MCGISINLDPEIHLKTAHRGISTKIIQIGKFTVAHHRLPIQTNPGDNWAMPIKLTDDAWMLYNGEIFDYPTQFQNDVQFICEAYRIYGAELPEYLARYDGFYAIVIITPKDLFFFTDPLGKKQLYYNRNGEVSSEIKGLPFTGLNHPFLAAVGAHRYPTSQDTFVEGVFKAAAGGVYSSRLYQRPIKLRSAEGKVPYPGTLLRAMEVSVTNRTKGFPPISCLVSGGLDSTIIAYHLKDHAGITYYTIANGTDGHYIQAVEDMIGQKIIRLYGEEPNLRDVLIANEGPVDLGSMVPQYRLFQACETAVVITGDGADELFGGYTRSQYYDSRVEDLLELTHYHLPRLDKLAMRFTIESRQPFLSASVVAFTKRLPWKERQGKKVLKDTYRGLIPDPIIDRKKEPLKSTAIRTDERLNTYKLIQMIYEIYENT